MLCASGLGVFVTLGRIELLVEAPDSAQSHCLQVLGDRGERDAGLLADLPAGLPAPPKRLDAADKLRRGSDWNAMRARAAVLERGLPALPEAVNPLVGCLATHACSPRRPRARTNGLSRRSATEA